MRTVRFDLLECFLPGRGDNGGETMRPEHLIEEDEIIRRIVDDENRCLIDQGLLYMTGVTEDCLEDTVRSIRGNLQ